ncbi:hypothetical protein JVU11DRAFT_2349 [Chiua virens]|nr:hypothetical protein JVU11DRAFT_2349 [Chiua virens]
MAGASHFSGFNPHLPGAKYQFLSKALGATMWFFIFYRARGYDIHGKAMGTDTTMSMQSTTIDEVGYRMCDMLRLFSANVYHYNPTSQIWCLGWGTKINVSTVSDLRYALSSG